MPRQNFLSKASFVHAPEKLTKETILSIPAFIPSIKLVAEDKRIESMKFSYEQPTRDHYFIDVSVMPLNDQFTTISLHAVYANGRYFHQDENLAIVLHDFETAIQAALRGELAQFKPHVPRTGNGKKLVHLLQLIGSSISVFFLRKKLS